MKITYWDRKLMREQLDQKLTGLKALRIPEAGWIKGIREALGMTINDLAERMGIDPSRMRRIEYADKRGDLKLSTLKRVAESMDMDFVYGFVPKEGSLEEMIRAQARKNVEKRMKKLNQTMRLEMQDLTVEEQRKAMDDMIDQLLTDGTKLNWSR